MILFFSRLSLSFEIIMRKNSSEQLIDRVKHIVDVVKIVRAFSIENALYIILKKYKQTLYYIYI